MLIWVEIRDWKVVNKEIIILYNIIQYTTVQKFMIKTYSQYSKNIQTYSKTIILRNIITI